MIPSPQTPSVATINLTGEAGVVDLPNSKGWAIAPDGAPSPVASGALRSPAFGRLSTIARLSQGFTKGALIRPTGEAGATNLPNLFEQAAVALILLACLAIPAIFAGA